MGRSVVGMGRKPAYRNAEPGMLPKFNSASSDANLFSAPKSPEPTAAAPAAPRLKPLGTLPSLKPKRSWFGWLLGGNRRRANERLVQGEFRLQNVRPLQNNLRDDDNLTVVERPRAKLLYETPSVAAPQDDQDHAWNRLRGRKMENMVVKPD